MPAPLRRAFSLKSMKPHLGHVADVLHYHAHALSCHLFKCRFGHPALHGLGPLSDKAAGGRL
jgi:hypothetical protein